MSRYAKRGEFSQIDKLTFSSIRGVLECVWLKKLTNLLEILPTFNLIKSRCCTEPKGERSVTEQPQALVLFGCYVLRVILLFCWKHRWLIPAIYKCAQDICKIC